MREYLSDLSNICMFAFRVHFYFGKKDGRVNYRFLASIGQLLSNASEVCVFVCTRVREQGTLIGGTRTSNWFLTKLGRYRNEKFFEKIFLLEKRSMIRSQFV